jgi:hypothetical protein
MLPHALRLDLGCCKPVAQVRDQREVVVPVPLAVHMAWEVIQPCSLGEYSVRGGWLTVKYE